MNTNKTCVTVLIQFALLSLCTSKASAGLVVLMTGTVESGTLNGLSINGETFEFTATVASTVDSRPSNMFIGIFDLTQAMIVFGGGSQFAFDPSGAYWAQDYRPPGSQPLENYFGVGIFDIGDGSRSANKFGFEEIPPTIASFDPNIIQQLSHSAFTSTFASGLAPDADVARFENGPNSLRITSLSLSGASFSVIPEPSCLGVTSILTVLFYWRRRSGREH